MIYFQNFFYFSLELAIDNSSQPFSEINIANVFIPSHYLFVLFYLVLWYSVSASSRDFFLLLILLISTLYNFVIWTYSFTLSGLNVFWCSFYLAYLLKVKPVFNLKDDLSSGILLVSLVVFVFIWEWSWHFPCLNESCNYFLKSSISISMFIA